VDGMIRDARENIGKISLRIDAVHPNGLDDGVNAGGALPTRIGATEEVFFRPRARGLMARSAALLLISRRPSVR